MIIEGDGIVRVIKSKKSDGSIVAVEMMEISEADRNHLIRATHLISISTGGKKKNGAAKQKPALSRT